MPERWYPKDKDELVLAIDRERVALWNLVRQLDDTRMYKRDSNGWSPKDNIAHLSAWIRSFMGYHLDHRPWHEVLGVDKRLTDNSDFDGINELLFQRKRKLSAPDVLSEFLESCTELYSRLNAIPFDDLMQPRFPDDPEKRPLMNWVLSNTSEHFAEHRTYIEGILNGSKS